MTGARLPLADLAPGRAGQSSSAPVLDALNPKIRVTCAYQLDRPLGRVQVAGEGIRRSRDERRDEIVRLLLPSANCYSITSSARASNMGGTMRPSAAAVLRLRTSVNCVGRKIGNLAGFAPLRIWPV